MVYNPSLRQEPRSQRAGVIRAKQESPLLDWLDSTGRLLERETVEETELEEESEEEISDLMDNDDSSFDDDDSDDNLDLED